MFCKSCGKENAPEAAFCVACGRLLSNVANAPAVTMQPVQKPKKKNALVIALIVLSIVLAALLMLSLLGAFNGADKAAFASPEKSVEESKATVNSGREITASTVVREPLPEGSVNETGYYTDETGLLKDESKLLPGLMYFYNKTGVQPYVYFTKSINGLTETPSMDDMQTFAESKYTQLFTDDAHLLLVLFESDDSYRYWFTVGPRAKTVVDQEAGGILGGYIDKYYNYMSLTYEQFLSNVFRETADSIMSTTSG